MKAFFSILLLCLIYTSIFGQEKAISTDTTIAISIKKHIPRIATQRSAMLPGWGQAYNKQYWKIPLVYGILSAPVATYVYNNDLYAKTKFAYVARIQEANGDNSDVIKIDPSLKNLSAGSLQSYRNIFRKNRDLSIMWFIIAWGVNVMDATVSGHLKEFDVSNNLVIQMAPMKSDAYQQAGLSLQFKWKYTK
jgi:hypothetical protein